MDHPKIAFDMEPFNSLVGEDIARLIVQAAPKKVASRISKALDHYTKAARLQGVDDEMGIIRLIAAEEELVVAIFEWLKLNAKFMPDHADFIGKFKNHLVKLAFYPVLSQLSFILSDMFRGITLEGLEHVLHWRVMPTRHEDRVVLRIEDREGKLLVNVNPLDLAIALGERPEHEVVDELFADFEQMVANHHGLTVRQFVTARADFRNKLLYAEDGGTFSIAETLEQLTRDFFSKSLRDLLWCIAALLTNKPSMRSWGPVSQFIGCTGRSSGRANSLREEVVAKPGKDRSISWGDRTPYPSMDQSWCLGRLWFHPLTTKPIPPAIP
jgi:hypothetical protein